VPDLSHLWQRFVLASALIFGLALGVAATVFGYSNTGPVDIGFSVLHLRGIPLWTVAIVPLVLVLAAGTLYHWLNSLHHFSEHMRHRKRVRELEAEVASLRAHLDNVLAMPDQSATKPAPAPEVVEIPETIELEPAPSVPEPVASNGGDKAAKKSRKQVSPATEAEPETIAVATDGSPETEPRAETQPGA
jgi:hypothetical protein